MTDIHYAYKQVEELRRASDILKLFVLVDGVQYDRAFDEPLKENQSVRSLLRFPEDRSIAFAGPWLLDVGEISQDHCHKLFQLERKYPAVSWIISDQAFLTLAKHLESCLLVSFPSKQTGLFRFYDCRVLKRLPDILSTEQIANLMKYTLSWIFRYEDNFNNYQFSMGVLHAEIINERAGNKEV